MRIVVFVKQVPEVAELRLDPETHRLSREGVESMMNPFDRRAMLEARRLRDEVGGHITALTMGPPQAERVLRDCLGLGADAAVHLCDPGFAGADTLATAQALASATRRLGFDLVIAGRYSVDSETGQVAPEVAALLEVPFLGGVRRLQATSGGKGWDLAAECEGDDGYAELEARAPVVTTCTDRWKTRIPRIMPDEEAEENGKVETWGIADLEGPSSAYGQEGSPTWVAEVQPVSSERRQACVGYDEEPDRSIEQLIEEVELAQRAGKEVSEQGFPPERSGRTEDQAIWVLGELDPHGKVRPVTWELLAAADRLASVLGSSTALFMLESRRVSEGAVHDEAEFALEVGRHGGDILMRSEEPDADAVEVLTGAIGRFSPRMVLAPATSLGRDLVPQVAARLGLGLTGDAIGLELDGQGRLQQFKPAFGGQVVAPILSRTRPEMVTLRPGVLGAMPPRPEAAPAKVRVLAGGSSKFKVRCRQVVVEVGAREGALEAARVVVCVGFGLGQDAVARAGELAAKWGGVLAGSRRVCDLGWLPRQAQIGLSGRSVAPDAYLALGVRGSFNHMVGVRRAGTILAVNNDPEAEVFSSADFGVVGDAPRVLDELLSKLA